MKFIIYIKRRSRYAPPKDSTGQFTYMDLKGVPEGSLVYQGRYLTAKEFNEACERLLADARIKNGTLHFLVIEGENPELDGLRGVIKQLREELAAQAEEPKPTGVEDFDDSLVDYVDEESEEQEEPEEDSEPSGFHDPEFWKGLSEAEVTQYVREFEPAQLREIVLAATGEKINGRKSADNQQADAVALLYQEPSDELDIS